MKNIMFITASLALSAAGAGAQVMGFREPVANVALKVGGSVMHLSSAPVKSAIGPTLGAYVWKTLGRGGLRLEVTGTMVNYTTKVPASTYLIYSPGMDTTTPAKFQAIYLSVPLLFEYQLNEDLQVVAGPQFNYLISLKDKNEVYTTLYGSSKFLKKIDFAVAAGVEYKLGLKTKLGGRIIAGVTDVNDNKFYLVPRTWSSVGGQITISYKIM